LHYRDEIDGVRAIAISSVILFHSGVSFFSGGYVGVDIFFVISGFLIMKIVAGEIEQGRFTFVRLYAHRAAHCPRSSSWPPSSAPFRWFFFFLRI
jgi:peptidoglycan/LPS O-acetylase OafA/YrhL